tara:strand:+ start:146 stop:331 length:186 start_codon:yes stop_codon:yes gene_type:complete
MGFLLYPLWFLFFLVVFGMGIKLFIIGVKEKNTKGKLLGLTTALLALIVGYITIGNMLNAM